MCRPNERTHKHHIIPRYMGGSNSPENIVEVTVTQHAMFHFCNYQLWGNEEDRIAWRGLSGLITPDEVALEAMILGGKKGGNKNKENKTGICGLSLEERIEAGKKGGPIGGKITGKKHKENKTGIFGRSPEQITKDSRRGAQSQIENNLGIFGRSLEKMSEDGRKAGKIGGTITYEKGIGVHGRSPEKMSEDGRKAGKIGGPKGGKSVSAQKWKCTETGYVSHAGGLTYYQNKRGIDTAKRIKVDGPRGWEITFEDGRVIVTYQTLKDWAKENSYSYQSLIAVRGGKIKNHKGIIKITCF
jgi:hypothetical protein